MKDYLKQFETIGQYESWLSSNDYIEPSVSHTLDNNVVHYQPISPAYDYSQDYLTIESLEDNNTIGWKASNAKLQNIISISTDEGNTWTAKESSYYGTTLTTLNTGDKLLIKGANTIYGNVYSYYNYFTSTGNFNVEGNIMSLIYEDNFEDQTTLDSSGYNFRELFRDCNKLISAENLILPTTTLAQYCYRAMFYGCTSLITAPELPATTLSQDCYFYMFYGCSSLTTAPELPATTLADSCYNGMFISCTSLTSAPELPATTLAQQCYRVMFNGCTSLTSAPELPATTVGYYCYYGMFQGCISLNYIKCLATNISAYSCTDNWVTNVAASGTFIKDASMSSWKTGKSGIPSGWIIQDAA